MKLNVFLLVVLVISVAANLVPQAVSDLCQAWEKRDIAKAQQPWLAERFSITRPEVVEAIKVARAGQPLNRIGRAIEQVANTHRLRIIENLGGHGVGRAIHEEPEHILGFYDPRDQRVLKEGMVIAIEPFLSTKSRTVSESDDGWTLVGMPGNLSAQFEHTMIITRSEPIVVTVH